MHGVQEVESSNLSGPTILTLQLPGGRSITLPVTPDGRVEIGEMREVKP